MDRASAEESVAVRFTRVMNATPSRWGVLSDVTFGAIASAVILVVGLLIAGRVDRAGSFFGVALAVACVPALVSIVASLALRGSRDRVIDWLASIPFEIVNMNALLAGLGDTIEVVFRKGSPPLPERSELQPKLDEVSDDALMIRARVDERLIEIRLGVIDSKKNPLLTNHRRYARLIEVTEKVLVPLHARTPIERVHVV
jgi:hypothetical protein